MTQYKSMSPCNLYIFFWTFHGGWLLQIDKGLISGTLLKASDISLWCKLINFLTRRLTKFVVLQVLIRKLYISNCIWLLKYWNFFLKRVGLADMCMSVYNFEIFLCLSELKDHGQRLLFTKGQHYNYLYCLCYQVI